MIVKSPENVSRPLPGRKGFGFGRPPPFPFAHVRQAPSRLSRLYPVGPDRVRPRSPPLPCTSRIPSVPSDDPLFLKRTVTKTSRSGGRNRPAREGGFVRLGSSPRSAPSRPVEPTQGPAQRVAGFAIVVCPDPLGYSLT